MAFKLPRKHELSQLDARIIEDQPGAKWLTFELGSGENIPEALAWIRKAYDQAR